MTRPVLRLRRTSAGACLAAVALVLGAMGCAGGSAARDPSAGTTSGPGGSDHVTSDSSLEDGVGELSSPSSDYSAPTASKGDRGGSTYEPPPPAPEATSFTSPILFPTTLRPLHTAAPTMMAVPC